MAAVAPAPITTPAQACPQPGNAVIPAQQKPEKAEKPKAAKRPRAASKAPAPEPEEAPAAPETCEKVPETGTWLIVAKAVRTHLKSNEGASMHCGSCALPALNAEVLNLIEAAIARAQANGRKTLKACDF